MVAGGKELIQKIIMGTVRIRTQAREWAEEVVINQISYE